jgi:alpha-glucosidase
VRNTAQPGGSVNTQPEPGGFQILPDSAVYEPLAFEVGAEAAAQYYGGLYEGNELVGAGGGAAFGPTRVTRVAAQGSRLTLDVATSDPTRTMRVAIAPDGRSAFRVRARLNDARGVAAFGDAFAAVPREAFHGFGGRHNSIDQRGQNLDNWIAQENFGNDRLGPLFTVIPGSNAPHYIFPNGPTAAYYVHNGFVSSRPYGFLLNQTELTRWHMASDRSRAWQVSSGSRTLDYTVAVAGGSRAVRTLSAINGSQTLPPEWAEGAFPYRAVALDGETVERYETRIRDDVKHILRDRSLGVTAYDYEGWHGLPESFVRRINARLRSHGVHPVGYLRGFVSNDGGFFDGPGLWHDALTKGYLARTASGQPYVYPSAGPAGVIDFTNPAAIRWWAGRVRHMLDLGFDGFMEDFGEQVLQDMRFHDGETGATMHNRFPVVYHRVTGRILRRYERAHPGRGRIFTFTRAGFSGRRGAAAYEGANFPGDETADWLHGTGISSLATDMLNRSLLGSIGFTTDIGGYIDSITGQTSPELFLRWTEWSVMTPFLRVHNDSSSFTKMPWTFGPALERRWAALARLHRRALPLIRRLWRAFPRTGVPPAAPLWLMAPGDASAARQDQEWMLGRDVLVAPVVERGATARSVYFPRGCWVDPATHRRYSGRGSARVAAPVDRLPYFTRCGKHPFARRPSGEGRG